MGGYGLRRSRPSGLPNTVAAVGMHIFLAGSLGQSHLRGKLHPCSSPHWYCVLAGTSGLAVTTTSTTICSIRYACLISRPRRGRWTWREEAWAGHAPKVRLWRNLGERSVVFSVVRSESLTEVEIGGWGPVLGRVISYAWDWISGCFPLIGGKRMQVKSCARCIISRNTAFRTLLFFSLPALKPTRTSDRYIQTSASERPFRRWTKQDDVGILYLTLSTSISSKSYLRITHSCHSLV